MSGDILQANDLSKWYGEVIGLNSLDLHITSGITGIVGPNGAGKSTLFKLALGMIKPNSGEIRVMNTRPWMNSDLLKNIGFCPDYDNLADDSTGREFLELVGKLRGMDRTYLERRISEVSTIVGMVKALDRKIGGYSRGMRQRIKVAGSILHEPTLLLLDEPLSGADPQARKELIDVIRSLYQEQGHDIIVSSHVLFEIERITRKIALLYKGRAIASGDISEIRGLMDEHPHNIVIEGDKIEELAKRFLDFEYIVSINFKDGRDRLVVEVTDPEKFFESVPTLVTEVGCEVEKFYSLDDDLEAVFRYLVMG